MNDRELSVSSSLGDEKEKSSGFRVVFCPETADKFGLLVPLTSSAVNCDNRVFNLDVILGKLGTDKCRLIPLRPSRSATDAEFPFRRHSWLVP